MTEQQWLECTDPQPMLSFLMQTLSITATGMQQVAAAAMRRRSGWNRKFRLYACGWSRHHWDRLADERLRQALAITEEYADGVGSDKAFRQAKRHVTVACNQALATVGQDGWAPHIASFILDATSLRFMPGWSGHLTGLSGTRSVDVQNHMDELGRVQCDLLRDLFGPLPFRRVLLGSAMMTWNSGFIPQLAHNIYGERVFDRLPELADALERAGCTNADIVGHCRSKVPHVRGCWVVDLILGKE